MRLRCNASNSSRIAASQCGSRRAARADEGNGDGGEDDVDTAHAYSSVAYRKLGWWIPARDRVTIPVDGGSAAAGATDDVDI